MRTLDRLHVEVNGAGGFILTDRGISGVCQRAGLSIAETGNIVFVATEVLFLGGSAEVRLRWLLAWRSLLYLKGAELLVDNLPDYLV